MKKPEVLIVGAGPTGLMMACQLALRNIAFRIVDKTEDHTTQSRALVIHARSLEIFQQMGIAEEAVQQGKIAKAVNLIVNGKRNLRFEFNNIGNNLTDFPFLLILEQSKTEAILNNYLDRFQKRVERNTELIEFSQNENGVTAILQKQNEPQETVEVSWLIGADGAHSIVREKSGIAFLGKTYDESLFVLDCVVNLNLPPNEMYLAFSRETFAGLFPMTNGRCRVIGIVPKELEQSETITFEDVNKHFAAKTRLSIELQSPEWISKYHSHHRVVNAFRNKRCFLAGDAAHIHSPVGAQGMNTGLQDAYNLAWKLALVIQNKAYENLLDTYQDERIEIAQRLVKTTDRAFHIITQEGRFSKFFLTTIIPLSLKLVLPIAQKTKFVGNMAFKMISEIGLHYRKSRLSDQENFSFNKASPKPGDRVPYNSLRKSFTEGACFHLLIFSKENFSDSVNEEINAIALLYSGLLKINNIPFGTHTKTIYKQFGIQDKGFYLIRPDSYVAYRSQSFNMTRFKNYLKKILIQT